ncbi:hypothetical protein Bsub01_01810 [Bacillus subtilis]|nr:hypothetical protein BSBS38_03338 [Bacillus subtilis]ARW00165.1 hypothetical protein S101444_03344 [Bacillus subtilis subsp. subtilis]BAI86846.1 hypothetical protein BSNT_09790 [Bacillus subtilis subsp. natto BEST195]BDB94479.1 hypothetical protein BSG8_32310 [Bacillus subtilis subsp. natto]GAK81905.1 hypothetical protein BSMD_038410 [Bacillus subtilis Miyagi-4]
MYKNMQMTYTRSHKKEIKKLKESGEIDEVLHKWNEPKYQTENKVLGLLGTKGDV